MYLDDKQISFGNQFPERLVKNQMNISLSKIKSKTKIDNKNSYTNVYLPISVFFLGIRFSFIERFTPKLKFRDKKILLNFEETKGGISISIYNLL